MKAKHPNTLYTLLAKSCWWRCFSNFINGSII